MPIMIKSLLLCAMALVYVLLIELSHKPLFTCFDHRVGNQVPLDIISVTVVVLFVIAVALHGRQVEWMTRLDFLWQLQAKEEKHEMEALQTSNKRILFNLLPAHVATHFLDAQLRSNLQGTAICGAQELYSHAYSRVGVLFASITNFHEFYMELDLNNQGVECLRLLNEIIADFDDLMGDERFRAVDKIKTIGSTYMAAVGLIPEFKILDDNEDGGVSAVHYMAQLVEYVFGLRDKLANINENSYNNFTLRVGMNVGPVVAGVIGARKPQYDIWGNTVNVASRMDSTGMPNYTQVTEEVYDILKNAQAYEFNCRGKIKVKGKGDMTTYFLTDRRATATMRVDDLMAQHAHHQQQQFYINQQLQHHMVQQPMLQQPMLQHQPLNQQPMLQHQPLSQQPMLQQPMLQQPMLQHQNLNQAQYSNIGSQAWNLHTNQQQQRHFNDSRGLAIHEEEEEPLIPPRSTSKPKVVRTVRPQTPPNHQRVMEATNEMSHARLHTPPRALLNMDITQRNLHEPPLPVTQPQRPLMHPPIAALVSQRREALVRTNPRLRHNPPASVHQLYQNPRSMQQPRFQPRAGPSTSSANYQEYPPQMPRYHSEESLLSKGGNGLYSSRIHSSADEISSINRSPSELSSSDESFSRTDFSRDDDGESPSPPSRPRSHAPWIYPSDIQIDPSSLEVSPKLQHAEFPGLEANISEADDALRDPRMPVIGPSPSSFSNNKNGASSVSRETTEDREDEVPDEAEEEEEDCEDEGLRKRLNLPHGVGAAESCRSASPGDGLTDSYRGDSCGSFEFLSKSRRGRGHLDSDEDDDEDDQRLFFPSRNEEKEAILRQIQTLNDGTTTEESRESSAQPEEANTSQVSEILEEIQKAVASSKDKTPASSILSLSSTERSVPLVVAVADAARNPRIRGKPSRLRDLQQPVPMEENPSEASNEDSNSFNFERDIARIIKEQEIVSKRMKEFEEGFAMSKSPTVSEAKIGFAAIQGMARLQEQQACDLSFLRFDPRSNRMTLESTKSSTHDGSTSSPSLAKFPLEIPITPVASPRLLWRNRGKDSEYENVDSDVDNSKNVVPGRSESEQREIDEFEEEERKILSQSEKVQEASSGLAFAIPGRWTGGKREEDEMRRLMAQEALEAKARGELLEETSASDWSSNEDDNAHHDLPALQEENLEKVISQAEPIQASQPEKIEAEPQAIPSRRRMRDLDTGNEADMDDTSMSSRASSRMLESINVISMDSMNVMYDSEYDDLRLASASAGGPLMSDVEESDLLPEVDLDLNNVLDNVMDEPVNANDADLDPIEAPISTLVDDESEPIRPTQQDEKAELKE